MELPIPSRRAKLEGLFQTNKNIYLSISIIIALFFVDLFKYCTFFCYFTYFGNTFRLKGFFMSDIFDRILKVRTSLQLNQKEFSEKLSISFRNLQNYETGKTENIPHTFILNLVEKFQINPYWLLFGEGQMVDLYYSIEIPTKSKVLFLESFKISQNPNELDETLKEFLLSKSLKKLDLILRSNKFWDKILFNRLDSLNFKRILTRSLHDAKNVFNTETLSVETAKVLLKKIIQEYEIRLYKDTLNNAITTKTKSKLIQWIDEEFDDITCFILLSDFDNSINAIKSTLNTIDQLTINLN